jgi:hypothetical protein
VVNDTRDDGIAAWLWKLNFRTPRDAKPAPSSRRRTLLVLNKFGVQKMVNIGEVVDGITTVFDTIRTVAGVYQQGRSLIRELRNSSNSEDLSQSLTVRELQVQNDYDGHVRRIGRRFESGDVVLVL